MVSPVALEVSGSQAIILSEYNQTGLSLVKVDITSYTVLESSLYLPNYPYRSLMPDSFVIDDDVNQTYYLGSRLNGSAILIR